MIDEKREEVRAAVRKHYGRIAETGGSCGRGAGCCGGAPSGQLAIGYEPSDLAAAPEGTNLGLGCGNPQAIAGLRPGEDVLDLGSGGGFDCFLAARQVGPAGHVIGVDMTAEMLARARAAAARVGVANVEFRLGEIEHLPVADASVDVVLSNCVVNLSPDKAAVFREAFRVLRPGGRVAISDVVAIAPLPPALAGDLAAHSACVAGAAGVEDLKRWLGDAGFSDVSVRVPEGSRADADSVPGSDGAGHVASASIEAVKPGGATRA